MPGNDLSDMFNSIPPVTRYWFSGTILFSLLGKFNIIDPMRMILLWNRMYSNFEVCYLYSLPFYRYGGQSQLCCSIQYPHQLGFTS